MDKTEAVKTEEQGEEDVEQQLLAQAGALLSKAATSKKRKGAILKQVEEILSQIKLADYEDLAESPVIQTFLRSIDTNGMRPGEVRNRGTLAEVHREWTLPDLAKMEQVTFIPAFSDDYTWNGVGPFRLVAGVECTVPKPIYERYREVVFIKRESARHLDWLLGKSDVTPHPDFQTVEGAQVRAQSLAGRQYGVQGGTLGTGIIHEGTQKKAEEE